MDDLYNKLAAIHSLVKKNFTYKTDKENYGVEEVWNMPPNDYTGTQHLDGDCEDFALACRKLCREQNIPTRLVVCAVQGAGHCVLEASGWILDVNYDEPKPRDDLDYEWISMSGFERGQPWTLIKG